MRKIITLTILLLQSVLGYAQVQVEATIDPIEILIGQQARLDLSVTANKGTAITMPRFQPQQMLTPGVEVSDDNSADTVEVENGMQKITRHYILTSFDERLYYLPAMEVKAGGRSYKSRSLALKVHTVDVDTLHPNKFFPPKEVQDNPFQWSEWSGLFYLSLLLVLICVVCYYLYVRLKGDKPIIVRVKIIKRVPPHKKAINEIELLKRDRMASSDNQKEYYTKLTDTIRTYIRERFGFNAMEMTSSEIIERLKKEQDREKTDELKMLFETADLVKFAKYSTLINENDMNLVNAINFINSTKQDVDVKEECIAPQLTETEKRSVRSRKAVKWTIIILAICGLALLVYIGAGVWQLLI